MIGFHRHDTMPETREEADVGFFGIKRKWRAGMEAKQRRRRRRRLRQKGAAKAAAQRRRNTVT